MKLILLALLPVAFCLGGPFGILTDATFTVPADLGSAPYSVFKSSSYDQTFLVTATGGVGPVTLGFNGILAATSYTDGPGESFSSSDSITSPFGAFTPGAIPQGSFSVGCSFVLCSIPLIYDVPQVVRFVAQSNAFYSFQPSLAGAGALSPLAGVTIHTFVELDGALLVRGFQIQTGSTVDFVQITPEPGTLLLCGLGVVLLVIRRPRQL